MLRKVLLSLSILALAATAGYAQPVKQFPEHLKKGVELYDAAAYRAARVELEKAYGFTNPELAGDASRIEFLVAMCAARLGDDDAMRLVKEFKAKYPSSVYDAEVTFALANLYYLQGDYAAAAKEYVAMGGAYSLPTALLDEYNFKKGHSQFLTGDINGALSSLKMVGRDSEYNQHAQYYTSYINYTEGNYREAKRGFSQLAENSAYSKVVPFYIFQIEFLEGNYDYVLKNGPALLKSAAGERVAEINRVMSEACFHTGDYAGAIDYMTAYRTSGGDMGRAENYLLGYSQYVRNDISDAVASLSKVAGPDDKLTQNAAYHLGGAYLRAGDKTRAMQSFSMAASATYDAAIREDALFNYAKLQYELGGGVFSEAINSLNRYITEYPDSPRVEEARKYLVSAYYNSKNYDAAYDAIKQVKNPDNNIRTALQKVTYFRALGYYNSGELDKAMTMLNESYANRFNAKYTALTQFWKGEVNYQKGNYKAAVPLYREYITLSPANEPEHQMALYNLGYCYFNQKQWGEAKTYFERFRKTGAATGTYLADAMNRLGDVKYAERDFWKAIQDYNYSEKLDTEFKYYSQYSSAVTYGLVDRRERKIEGLRAIITANEGEYVDDAMYELGRTYVAAERFGDAASMLKRYMDNYPNGEYYLASLSDLGLVYQNLNDDRSALKYYQKVVETAPNSAQARDAMVAVKSIYVDMNDVDGYFKFASASGVETDMGVVARDSLSYAAAERVYMTTSSLPAAERALKEYIEKYPRGAYKAGALYNLADVQERSKKPGEAVITLCELSEMPYNRHTVSGLEKLAALSYSAEMYNTSADAYKKLTEVAVNPETRGKAWAGYLLSATSIGTADAKNAAAESVIAGSGVPLNVMREAKFIKAGLLKDAENDAAALEIYKELATEVQSKEGAEAMYYVVEAEYNAGRLDSAEAMIMEFAKKNTPHSYWLGRAFLTLGDIYTKKGDAFQARATYQSIVDGYMPANDGVVAAAKERISKISVE